MILYFNKFGELTTSIPHGEPVRQGNNINLYVYLDVDFFETDEDIETHKINIEFTMPKNGAVSSVPQIMQFQGIKQFKKITDSEIIYDLVNNREYLCYYSLVQSGISTVYPGNLIANVSIVNTENAESTEVKDVRYTGSAQIFVERTFGSTQRVSDVSSSHYQQLLNQLNNFVAQKEDRANVGGTINFSQNLLTNLNGFTYTSAKFNEENILVDDENNVIIDEIAIKPYLKLLLGNSYVPKINNQLGRGIFLITSDDKKIWRLTYNSSVGLKAEEWTNTLPCVFDVDGDEIKEKYASKEYVEKNYLPLTGAELTEDLKIEGNIWVGELNSNLVDTDSILLGDSGLNFNSKGNEYRIEFPEKNGTVAYIKDLESYLPLTGGTIDGDLIIHSNEDQDYKTRILNSRIEFYCGEKTKTSLYTMSGEKICYRRSEDVKPIDEEIATHKDLEIVRQIAEGKSRAISYVDFPTCIDSLNNDEFKETLKIGDNIFIQAIDVPDIWVMGISDEKITYNYINDDVFKSALQAEGGVQVGYFILSTLETNKISLDLAYLSLTGGTITGNLSIIDSDEGTGIRIGKNGIISGDGVSKGYLEFSNDGKIYYSDDMQFDNGEKYEIATVKQISEINKRIDGISGGGNSDLSNYVDKSSTEEIGGVKKFTSDIQVKGVIRAVGNNNASDGHYITIKGQDICDNNGDAIISTSNDGHKFLYNGNEIATLNDIEVAIGNALRGNY